MAEEKNSEETAVEDAQAPQGAKPDEPAKPDESAKPDEPAKPDGSAKPEGAGESEAEVADAPVPSAEQMSAWRGYKLDDMRGTKTAKVLGVMVDVASGEPQWLLVRVGLFGHHTLVPARTAVAAGEHVWVPHTREEIRAAPKLDPDEGVRASVEREVLEHYGLSGAAERVAEIEKRGADQTSVELKTA